MKYRLGGIALTAVLLVGCANSSDTVEQGRSDPLEGFNRTMFNFNYDVLDPYVLRPVAVAWHDYVPMPARNGLGNFLSNLEEPASMVNSFLRGNPYQGMKHFNRFFLNTILGMGGLIDVATMANPKLAKEEPKRFGSTLGYYKVGYGPYVVLPGYGSFTLRDEGGDWADMTYPMLSYLTIWMSAGKWAFEGIETRARLLDSDGLLKNSSDPYLMMREAYFQSHDFMASGGKLEATKNPNAEALQDDLDSID
ncbi:phospholipid-binding lipoprotein MlaA [Photorhabdus sp. HUG-39]|uniref:Phospholipid-binding lipoprotein MlaA n=1 Tax=Photorhabdus kayaii TaxID=230088 RepID=A0ABX0B443_9GAMM|nr:MULTISPECIES: phospholipid-binding lipoprotein MlaA [Photorhabdus]MCC8372468.1 phospholipid-binding lipoprotein MlaA [Photorhabdus bodei]MDB6368087.1 phospholipid-binding lipoprotein MlaA [Photorhabdus bodei]NDL11682.1 phospholipid-binding lipoprotein MlaA [Photorhabdus kayaii]NDL25316.1 phospholipid-binding lipoprotein MlaA [Photorhabdus kayaii]RAX10457.1 phospholipid-binding lipoprotein MlaA [Photorhabdus sp. HUG-39]